MCWKWRDELTLIREKINVGWNCCLRGRRQFACGAPGRFLRGVPAGPLRVRRRIACARAVSRWSSRPKGKFVAADLHLDEMLASVIPEGDSLPGYLLAIDGEQARAGRVRVEAVDADVIDGLAVTVVDLDARPGLWQAGSQAQLVTLQVHSQQGFDEKAVHPSRGARVPGPTASAQVGSDRIDVGGGDVRFNLVGGDLPGRAAAVDGIEQREELPRALAVSNEGECDGGPDRGLSVLAAVFTHTWTITFYV